MWVGMKEKKNEERVVIYKQKTNIDCKGDQWHFENVVNVSNRVKKCMKPINLSEQATINNQGVFEFYYLKWQRGLIQIISSDTCINCLKTCALWMWHVLEYIIWRS